MTFSLSLSLSSQCVSGDDAVAVGTTHPVAMTMPLSPLSSDEEQQKMLGNSQHLYPGAEEEEEEEEGEEEEELEDEYQDEDGEEEENGELNGEEEEEEDEEEVRRSGGRAEGRRQKATGRSVRVTNPGHTTNPYSSNPGPTHQLAANQQQQKKLRRGSSSALDDAHIALMVFRIGIPDIKQTVSLTRTHDQRWSYCCHL